MLTVLVLLAGGMACGAVGAAAADGPEYTEIPSRQIGFQVIPWEDARIQLRIQSPYVPGRVLINDVPLEHPVVAKSSNAFMLQVLESQIPKNELFSIKMDLVDSDNTVVERKTVSGIYFGDAIVPTNGHCMGIATLAELSRLTQMRHLILMSDYNDRFTGTVDDLLPLKNLETIYVFGWYDIVGDMSRLRSVRQLYLSGYAALDSTVYDMPNLETLSLSNPRSTIWDKADFDKIAAMLSLQKLAIAGSEKAKGDIASLQNTNLEALAITGLEEEIDLDTLAGIASLQSLSLNDCKNVKGDIQSLAALGGLETVELIQLWKISGDLSSFSGLTNLRSVNVTTCPLSGDSASMAPLINLELLILWGVDLSGQITELNTLEKLTYLHIQEGGALSGDIAALRLPRLEYLELVFCDKLTGDASAVVLPSLLYGDVSYCENITGKLKLP